MAQDKKASDLETELKAEIARESLQAASQAAPLDETIPGGQYLGPDGVAHDAHGNVLKSEAK